MRQKIEKVLQKIYGIALMIAFFAGLLPLFPFIAAIIIGGGEGGTGEAIGTWLYNSYYPWVIALASIAILIGLVAMYVGKKEAFSTKSFGMDKKKEEKTEAIKEAAEEEVKEFTPEAVNEVVKEEIPEEIKEEIKEET